MELGAVVAPRRKWREGNGKRREGEGKQEKDNEQAREENGCEVCEHERKGREGE